MYQNQNMVATIDYSSLIREQSSLVERGIHRVNFFIRIKLPFFLILSFANWTIKKMNNRLSMQLLLSKGALANLKEDFENLKGQDLSPLITDLNELNILNIDFNTHIEKALNEGLGNYIKGITNTKNLLEETIEVQYDLIRLLKKANKIVPMQTSDVAKSISAHSFDNMQKVNYGR